MSQYLYAVRSETPGAASLFAIQGVEHDYLFGTGASIEELGVGDAPYFEVDGSFKGPLEEVVEALSTTLVVNDRVRRIIEEFDTNHIEFIPVELRYSNGETVADYFVCQPTDLPDALDDDASGARCRSDGTVRRVSQLVVDEDKLEGRVLTRIARHSEPILVHTSLAARLEEEGVTGIRFKPMDEYTRFDRL